MTDDSGLPFWRHFGVAADPLAQTNAEFEDRLPDYFVAPPYFESVVGDPSTPAPVAVFAPRGAGKTAQRIMVEYQLPPDSLVLTYATFPNPVISGQQRVLAYHLTNLIREILLAISVHATEYQIPNPERINANILREIANTYLSNISRIEIDAYLNSVRTLRERARGLWRDWSEDAITAAGFFLASVGGSTTPGPFQFASTRKLPVARKPDPANDFRALAQVVSDMDIPSIYILIDSIDELAETQADREAAYKFVAPLLENLGIVETVPFAFKFFLTAELEPFWRERGGRSDRIEVFNTDWPNPTLLKVVSARIMAYNGDASLVRLLLGDDTWTERYLAFASGSPRDLLRLLRATVNEAVSSDPNNDTISTENRSRAIDTFCREKAREIATRRHLDRLTSAGLCDFTISDLAEKLGVKESTSRRIANSLEQAGLVTREREPVYFGRAGAPPALFVIPDIRVARFAMRDMPLEQFFADKFKACANGHGLVRDYEDWTSLTTECPQCGVRFQFEQ